MLPGPGPTPAIKVQLSGVGKQAMAGKGDVFTSGWADRWNGEPQSLGGYTGGSSLARSLPRAWAGSRRAGQSPGSVSLLLSGPPEPQLGPRRPASPRRDGWEDPRCWWPGLLAVAGTREAGRLGRTGVDTEFHGGVRHGGAQLQPQYGKGAVHSLGLVPRFGGETRCLGTPWGPVTAGLQGLVLRREAGAREGVGRRPWVPRGAAQPQVG